MRRRDFIKGIVGSATAWPLAARAQQPEHMRRIGVLLPTADDQEARIRLTTFQQALEGLGWTNGRNVHIDTRLSAGKAADTRKYAAELAALAPDVFVVVGSSGLPAALEATRTVPIVFVLVPDPVGSGFVHSLSQPGGNATGFMMFEYNLCGKWPELLKEIAPGVTRAAVLRDPALVAGIGQFAVIQSVAPSVGLEVIPINLGDAAEIKREVAAFAQSANGGLISTASALSGYIVISSSLLPPSTSCPQSTKIAIMLPPAD